MCDVCTLSLLDRNLLHGNMQISLSMSVLGYWKARINKRLQNEEKLITLMGY